MRPALLALIFALVIAPPALGATWTTNAFRTQSGGLVNHGDTMAEVLRSAGEPLRQRVLSTGITLGGLTGFTREQWTYRGNDGYYIVTFAADQVERIEVIADR